MEERYRQLCFDMNGRIMEEVVVETRELTDEEKQDYEKIIQCADQMSIMDFL